MNKQGRVKIFHRDVLSSEYLQLLDFMQIIIYEDYVHHICILWHIIFDRGSHVQSTMSISGIARNPARGGGGGVHFEPIRKKSSFAYFSYSNVLLLYLKYLIET